MVVQGSEAHSHAPISDESFDYTPLLSLVVHTYLDWCLCVKTGDALSIVGIISSLKTDPIWTYMPTKEKMQEI